MASKAVVNSNSGGGPRVQPLQIGKGASRDRTNDFLNTKNRINMYKDPSKRFGQVTNVIAQDAFNKDAGIERHASLHGNKNYAKFDDLGHGKNELPPLWVDIQESIEDQIAEAEEKFEKLKQLRTQRFKPRFDESENTKLDSQIDEIVDSLTKTIKKSEAQLSQMMSERAENESDQQIRKNIQQTYLFKLQDITRQLRQMEREHLLRVKDLYGEEGEVILNQLDKREQDYFADLDVKNDKDEKKRNLIQLEHFGEIQDQRSNDITRIVNQINELAVVFKELSTLVIEQGTVLDRIDYNIEHAKQNIEKGNVQLQKTLKRESSWRAMGCITCQVTWILVCTGLLVLKHM